MDCADIRRSFVAGQLPAGLEAEQHVKRCAGCQLLFEDGAALGRRLARAVPAPDAAASGELFASLSRELTREVGLRARLRALTTSTRVALALGFALALAAAQLLWSQRPDFVAYPRWTFWLLSALWGVALGVGLQRLALGARRPQRSVRRELGWTLTLLALPTLAALCAPLYGATEHADPWSGSASCFFYGAILTAPLLLLLWLFERRDAVPLLSAAFSGALAGLAANLLLHMHCPATHAPHLLIGHASIGVAWALLLMLIVRSSSRAPG